jgi:CHAT domain-containing protein/tetratricopeptide (TPR) repeat protein
MKNIKFVIAAIFLLLQLVLVTSQNNCEIDNLLEEVNILYVERQLPACRGEMRGWLEAVTVALEDETLPVLDKGRYQLYLGMLYLFDPSRESGNFEARMALQDAVVATREAQDSQLESFALYYTGLAFFESRQFSTATGWFNNAFSQAEATDNTFAQGRIILLRGQVALSEERYRDALILLDEAYPLLMENPQISIPEQIDNLAALSRIHAIFDNVQRSGLYRLQHETLADNPDLYAGIGVAADLGSCAITDPATYTDFMQYERLLDSCRFEASSLQGQLQELLATVTDDVEKARLRTLSGLTYFAANDYYNAARIHETALALYRDVLHDTTMTGQTFYFMGRSYLKRNQFDLALAYLGSAIRVAEDASDMLTVGRAQLLLGEYELNELQDAPTSSDTLKSALENLLIRANNAIPERIETLRLLNQAYAARGDRTRAEEYDLQYRTLLGLEDTIEQDYEYQATDDCPFDSWANEYNVMLVERSLIACVRELPALMLTAHARFYTSSDNRTRGLMQMYYGLGLYQRSDLQQAHEQLSGAISKLQTIGDQRLLAFAHYYLGLVYLEYGGIDEARTDLHTAQNIAEAAGDLFIQARVDRHFADEALADEAWDTAIRLYLDAYVAFEANPIWSLPEQSAIARSLITIYDEEVLLPDEEQRWRDILESLQSGKAPVTPTPTATGEELPEDDCNPLALAAARNLVDAEAIFITCPNQEAILQSVEVQLGQATTDIDKAFYENYQGILRFHLERYLDAFQNHNRAHNLYYNLGMQAELTRTRYYLGRTQIERGNEADGLQFILQAERDAEAQGDYRTVADISLFFGNDDYASGNFDAAIERFETARSNFEQSGYDSEAADMFLRLASIFDQRSQFSTAQQYFSEAATLALADESFAHYTQAQLGIARYEKYYGHYDVAQAAAQLALDNAPTPELIALAQAELGHIAAQRGDYAVAERIFAAFDPTQYNCAIANVIRVYHGDYLVLVGRGTQATPLFSVVTDVDCAEQAPVVKVEAYFGLADVELVRGSANELVNIAIENAARESRVLNYPVLSYPRGEQRTRLQAAELQRRLRHYDDAVALLAETERISADYTDLRGQVDAVSLLIDINIDRGEYEAAKNNLARAGTLFNQMDNTNGVYTTVEQEIRILLDQANYDEAIARIDEVQQTYSNLPISFESRITFYEGVLLEGQGRNEEALILYSRAQEGFEQAREILSVQDVLMRRVLIMHKRGLFADARNIILEMRESATALENPFYIGQAQLLLGDNYVLEFMQSPSASLNIAQPSYEAALAAYTEIGNEAGLAQVNLRLGEFEILRNENDIEPDEASAGTRRTAGQYLDTALVLYRRIGNRLGEVDAHTQYARYFLQRNDYNLTIERANTALIVLDELEYFDPFRRSTILMLRGLAREYQAHNNQSRSQLFEAIADYRETTSLVSFQFAEIADNNSQSAFATQTSNLLPYNRLIRIYGVVGNIDDAPEREAAVRADYINALNFAEESRARSYLAQMRSENVAISSEDDEVLAEWQQLRTEVIALNASLNALTARAGDNAETEPIQLEISNKLSRMAELENDIEFLPLLQLLKVSVAPIEEIQAAIPHDTAMIVYYVVEGGQTPVQLEATRIMIFVITQDAITLVPHYIENYQTNIKDQIDAVLRNRNQGSAGRLYTNLITPIDEQISAYDNLIIVPHGDLNSLPFDMLWDGSNWLIENKVISYAPSATVYTLLQQNIGEQPPGTQTLAMSYDGTAYIDSTYGLDQLYFTDTEVSNLLKLDPETLPFRANEANEEALGNLEDVGILHIAAHGVFDSSNPLNTFIALAPTANSDGHLEVRDIYNLNFANSYPLVTLSACNLARNRVLRGDELEGMTRAFLLTGARSVVAGMWQVPDGSTAELMNYFYTYRKTPGITNAQALAEAKRTMINSDNTTFSVPDAWAGFVLVGLPD